jgi:ATP-dependent Clp protease, protease subunit
MKHKKPKTFFQVATSQSGDVADVMLYGYIGQVPWDEEKEENLSDIAVARAIAELDEKVQRINIRVNSYGGSVKDGDGIISAMKRAKAEIHTYNDGMAASMGFSIWAAGQYRHASTAAKFMVHATRGGVWGTAKDMAEGAEMLKKMDESSIALLAELTGKEEEEINQLFFADYADHWLTRKDVQELGLINNEERYSSQFLPTTVEQMSYAELDAFFERQYQQGRGADTEESFLKKIQKLMPQWLQEMKAGGQLIISPIQSVQMNKQELENSLGKDITPEDVAEVLRAQGYEVQAQQSAPAVSAEELQRIITDAATASLAPLQAKIETLEQQITALGGQPGAAPAMPAKQEGDEDGSMSADEKARRERIKAIQAKFQQGFRDGVSVRIK